VGLSITLNCKSLPSDMGGSFITTTSLKEFMGSILEALIKMAEF